MVNSTRLSMLVAVLLVAGHSAVWAAAGAPIGEPGLRGRSDILFFEDFESPNWAGHWRNKDTQNARHDTHDESMARIGRHCVEYTFKQGSHSGGGGKFYMKPGLEKAHIRWYFRAEKGFDWSSGGKILGLRGSVKGSQAGKGGNARPNGRNGFSCRICWEKGGRATMYTYHMNQRGRYGDGFKPTVEGTFRIEPGRWYCFELMMKVNARDKKDGEIKFWVDGKLRGHKTDLQFSTLPELNLNEIRFDVYFGGTWSSPKDQKVWYDNIVLAHNYIGPAAAKPPAARKPARAKIVRFAPPARPSRPNDPLAKWREAISAAARSAQRGDTAAASTALSKLAERIEEEKPRTLVDQRIQGLRGVSSLIKRIQDGVRTQGAKAVYVDFAGRPMRARLVAADLKGGTFEMNGSRMPIPWRKVGLHRMAGIAAKYLDGRDAAANLDLARLYLALDECEAARKALDRARAAGAKAVHIRAIELALR